MTNTSTKIASDETQELLTQHHYKCIKFLSKGSFGSVFLIRSQYYNQDFCLKRIQSPDPSVAEESKREVSTLIRLYHPNIISMYKFFFDSSGCTLSIILEYCAGGSLKDVVLKEGPIKPPKLYWLCYQILDALSYCHEKNIAHRDIKPANILIDSYGRPKLADFGLSKIIEKGESTTSCTGSRPYMAPEIINRQNADPFLADIWSLGVTFYAIALGHLPWCCHSGIELDVAINIGMLPFPSNIDPAFRELIRSMVVVDPTKRMSLANLMNLPIFDEFRNPNNTLNSPHKPFIRVPQGKGKTMIPQVRPFFGLKGYAANTKSYRPITKPFVTPQKPNIMQSPHQTFGNKLFPNKPLE